MPRVIVFGNSLVNTMGLIRSVGEAGMPVTLLLEPCKKNHCYVRFSKYLEKVHYLMTIEEALDVLRNEYWDEAKKPVILCASDSSICLLDAHYDELKDHFCIFNAYGEQGRINFFMDKINQFPIAEKCGLKLIKTWHVEDVSRLPSDITYPCLIKGDNSVKSTKGDMFICWNEEDLRANLHEGVKYLVQEYIDKDCELDIVGLSCDHGNNVHITAAVSKLREKITRQSDYIRLDDIRCYGMLNIERIKIFVREIGYEGLFSIEFLKKGDEYYFLEINLRNDGVGYLYTAAGNNYPCLWVRYNAGESYMDVVKEAQCKTPFYLMSEGDLYNLVEGKVSLRQWIMDFHRTDAYFILNKHDIKPFVYQVYVHIRQACKKLLAKLFRKAC